MKIVVVSDVSPVQLLGGGERVLWEQKSRLSARKHVVKRRHGGELQPSAGELGKIHQAEVH